jgi:hypothetical protein
MKVDMSPEAVTIRLKRASQLRRLCLELGKMKPVPSSRTTYAKMEAPGPRSQMEALERHEPPSS